MLKNALLNSTALAGLVAAVPILALTTTPAAAVCSLSAGLGVTVACDAEFDADLTFDAEAETLTLFQSEGVTEVDTDLSGGDAITLDGALGSDTPNVLEVFTSTTTGETTGGATRSLDLAGGDDEVTLNSGRLIGTILGGAGEDAYSVFQNAEVFLDPLETVALDPAFSAENGIAFVGGADDDTITIGAGQELFFRLAGGDGDDTFLIDGTVGVPQNPDFDQDDPVGVAGGDGDDMFTIGSTGVISGLIDAGAGADVVEIDGSVEPFDGDDRITVRAGTGNDTITAGATARIEGILGDAMLPGDDDDDDDDGDAGIADDDVITVEAGAIIDGTVFGGRGNDTIASAGTVIVGLSGDDGDDLVTVSAGSVPAVFGGDGVDTLNYTGGVLETAEGFESVVVNEELSEALITTESLTVIGDGTTDLSIINTFEPEDEVDEPGESPGLDDEGDDDFESPGLADSAIAAAVVGDRTPFELVMDDIDVASVENSSFSITGVQGVNDLRLLNESLMRVIGQASLTGSEGGSDGALTVGGGSTLTFIDGATDGELAIGTLALTGGTLGIDVNPNTNESDQILIADSITQIDGDNFLDVNLTEEPDELGQLIPVASIIDEGDPEPGAPSLENITVIGFGDALDPTVGVDVVQGPDGGLFLVAEDEGVLVEAPSIITTQSAVLTNEAVTDVNNDIADNEIGFANPSAANRAQITPIFGVYANGQFGRVYHDGYEVSGDADAVTPGFEADNFSAIVTGELDATAALGFEDEDIGVKTSIFGGYVLSDVTLDRQAAGADPTPFEGTGRNEGGVLGVSVLASRVVGEGNLNYGLLSVAGFLGETEITNADNGADGEYDTEGFVISAKVGRNIAVEERVRLDLRFGLGYAGFYGDSFTDSEGIRFGETETSYGLVSFEPGISTAFLVNEFVVAPSARMLFQHRFAYENSGSVADADFDFDDADFSLGGQLGANVVFTERLSAGAFVEGRVSQDQRSALAKLAVKYVFAKN